MESRKTSGRIDDVAAGEDVGLSANYLAATITTTMTVFHTWSHFSRKLPALRCGRIGDRIGPVSRDWDWDGLNCGVISM